MAKEAIDKTPVGKLVPANMDFFKSGSGNNNGNDVTDGNSSSKGFFSGHQHNFRSGEGSVKKWSGQDYKQLKRECKSRGVLFEDPEFPASNRLLVDDNNQFLISYFGRTRFEQNSIEWLRPHVSYN